MKGGREEAKTSIPLFSGRTLHRLIHVHVHVHTCACTCTCRYTHVSTCKGESCMILQFGSGPVLWGGSG